MSDTTFLSSRNVLDLLTGLVDASLVVYEEQPDGTARYRLLETTREYARQCLRERKEEQNVHRRHLDYYLMRSKEISAHLRGPELGFWLAQMEVDYENVRVALAWSLPDTTLLPEQTESRVSLQGLRLTCTLQRFWFHHAEEGLHWLLRALEQNREAPLPLQARAAHWAGILLCNAGEYARGFTLLNQSLALWRQAETWDEATAVLQSIGSMARTHGDFTTAYRVYRESLELAERQGDTRRRAAVLGDLGWVAQHLGDGEQAIMHHRESVSLLREAGSRENVARALNGLGYSLWCKGDYSQAQVVLAESTRISEEVGSQMMIAWSSSNQARVALSQGAADAASRFLERSFHLFYEGKDQGGITWVLEQFAELAMVKHEPTRAVKLFGLSAAWREASGTPAPPSLHSQHAAKVAELRAWLGEETFAVEWKAGRAMTVDESIAYALQDVAVRDAIP